MPAIKTSPEITVNRAELARKLEFCSMASESKGTIPILSNVRLTACVNNLLKIAATNLDLNAVTSMTVDSQAEWEACVNAKRLTQFVKSLSGEEVTIGLGESSLKLQCSKSKLNLPVTNPDQFPVIQEAEGDSIAMPAGALAGLLKAVAFATTQEESRFNIRSIQLELSKDNARCVALDGKIMAVADVAIINKRELACLIPASAVNRIAALCEESQNEVAITIKNNTIWFEAGKFSISTRLSAGVFPAYKPVEALPAAQALTMDVEEFQSALTRVMLVTNVTTKGSQQIHLKTSDEEIEIRSTVSDLGSAVENLIIEDKLADFDLVGNAVQMVTAMNACKATKTTLHIEPHFLFKAQWPVTENTLLKWQFICTYVRL